MNSEVRQVVPAPQAPRYSVPWKFIDNWTGVGLLVLIDVIVALIMARASKPKVAQSIAVVFLELAYLLPVVLIFAWRRIDWKSLGFGKFDWSTLGIGCGFVIVSYGIIAVYGALLYAFGIETQGQQVIRLFAQLDSPIWLFIVGAIVAPLVEEIFFRGFLFQGFRQKYGWVTAMLLSSAIFAAAHLDPVAFIPVFLLGNVLAYVYHRSNSVWPGVILHFLVNTFGLFVAYFAAHQHFIPL